MLPVREKKQLIKPKALREGDRVGLIAPSSRPATPAAVASAERVVREMGFVPVLGQAVSNVHGFMAGTDQERLTDLNSFLKDEAIAGIFCIAGGYGATHLLSMLDYDSICASPKVIVGCDDNTVLLNALLVRSGLITFYGPNLDGITTRETFDRFRSAVMCSDALTLLSAHGHAEEDKNSLGFNPEFLCAVEGIVEGPLVGGNLTALVTLLGTPFEPRFQGAIIALDDVNEQTGMLDRWFTSLYLAGHLQTCRGVAFGAFDQCGPRGSWNMLSPMEVFADRLRYLGTPSCFGLPFGQTKNTTLLPLGINARLSAGAGTIEFSESALS